MTDFPVYLFDGWRFDTGRRELRDPRGREILLTGAEIRILDALCRNARRPVSRMDALPKPNGRPIPVMGRSVDVQVTRLRSKIEQDPKHPRLIKTIRYEGYVLVAAVEVERTTTIGTPPMASQESD
jgi:DNA-binding response OmpR family regulator